MTGLDRDRRLALTVARAAARRSLTFEACPWSAEDGNRARALRLVWGRTYAQERPDLCERAFAAGELGVLVVALWEPFAQGRDAAVEGLPLTLGSCPYPLDAPTAVGRAQFRAWCGGYDSVRPFPIDYSS